LGVKSEAVGADSAGSGGQTAAAVGDAADWGAGGSIAGQRVPQFAVTAGSAARTQSALNDAAHRIARLRVGAESIACLAVGTGRRTGAVFAVINIADSRCADAFGI
jgi:hypothetical protein